jgi:hypothetical protein
LFYLTGFSGVTTYVGRTKLEMAISNSREQTTGPFQGMSLEEGVAMLLRTDHYGIILCFYRVAVVLVPDPRGIFELDPYLLRPEVKASNVF